MPIAVEQIDPRELPRTVTFRGPDATVEVVARLSMSGRVTRAPDDVEIVSSPLALSHPPATVSLTLAGARRPDGLQAIWDGTFHGEGVRGD
jgi:hypothetical protein